MNKPELEWIILFLRGPRTHDNHVVANMVNAKKTDLTGYSYLRTVENKYEEWVPTDQLEWYKKNRGSL